MTSINKQAKWWLWFAVADQWFDSRALSERVTEDPLDSVVSRAAMMMINQLITYNFQFG